MTLLANLSFLGAAVALGLGGAAVLRRPWTVAQWSYFLGMLVFAAESLLNGLTFHALTPAKTMEWQRWNLMVSAPLSGIWFLFSLTYSRGNYSRFVKRWALLLVAFFLIPLLLAVFYRDSLIVKAIPTEQAYIYLLQLGPAGSALCVIRLLASILILMHLERTFQASVGTMRWRIKFLILGLALIFGVRVYTNSQHLLYSAINLSMTGVNAVTFLLGSVLILRSLLRVGLFGQDVYPSQSLLRYSLTGLLAGLYLLIVGVLAKVVALMGGSSSFPWEAMFILVALVGLALLLISERVRHFVRGFVSRHFHRPFYDYRLVWKSYLQKAGSMPVKDQFCRAVVRWVSETFNVLSVNLWLADEVKGKFLFGASSALEDNRHATPVDPGDTMEESMFQELRKQARPVDFDHSKEAWAIALKKQNPKFFPETGSRIYVPLITGETFLGFMTLGDRVGAAPFTMEDFDLLKDVGEQIATNLQNIQLSDQLVQVKEMEAFQVMSAFFVHDLKNTASTLSLMLKNMPAHFDDPEFRADALRGLGKSVTRINDLIQRLGLLRQEISLKRQPTDLSAVVKKILQDVHPLPQGTIHETLPPVPPALMDGDQIGKVLTNLIMNASEAVDADGQIHIETKARPGWVYVDIKDNGCGISPEFLSKSLFRPFQTTKNKGIGIGMFLSKRIVEAHGGKIEVESKPGEGTLFRVALPLEESRHEA